MALSDAAQALLLGKGTRSPAAPVSAPKPEREPSRTGYRERAQAEAERFRLATDSEYWLCFCFRTPQAAAAFAKAARLEVTGRYISGPALARNTRAPKQLAPRAARMLTARSTRDTGVTGQLSAAPPSDPFAALPAPTSIEQDSADELTALLTALTAPADPHPANILDSPYWLAACWPHRDAKDAWLTESGLDVLGDKYVDGHQAARLLGITL